ncbi:MAG: ATP-grasp domain-containing protein [Cetobacterium sp.]|uniref:ATP-grasp domain-containing protein n=1 Tax=Cetobacterium sp. TaxID=2071632 RepID=UPI003F333284
MKEILIIVDYREIFRRELKSYYTISIEKMKNVFINKNYEVQVYSYVDLLNEGLEKIQNKIIVYTSSSDEGYKRYIDDLLFYLKDSNEIYPKYELLKSQENKGFQELYKLKQNIKSLNSFYLCTLSDFYKIENKIEYPIILKKIDGAGSSQVFKLDSKEELVKKIKKSIRIKNYYNRKLKSIFAETMLKLNLNKKNHKLYKEYILEDLNIDPFILQEFVPDLESDWKILVFGKKFYALNRKVRKNDFRASGSGKLSFFDPPKEVLDYAYKIYKKLDVPIVSLDICIDKNFNCFLIEFQALHFGPYTLIKSDSYFQKNGNEWEKLEKKSDLAEEYSTAILEYINEKNS